MLRLRPEPSRCLLNRAQQDVRHFGAFYHAHYERVLTFLARRVFDPELAFDLLSETFAKALEHRHAFRGDSTPQEEAWLLAIARSELSHYWRAGKVERAALQRYAVAVPTLSGAEYGRIEALADLRALGDTLTEALSALPAAQRRAVRLRVVEELPYPRLAAALDVSEPAARARVSRGLRALAIALADSPLTDLVENVA